MHCSIILLNGLTDDIVKGQTDGRMDGWMEGRMDGRKDGWVKGRKDGRTKRSTESEMRIGI